MKVNLKAKYLQYFCKQDSNFTEVSPKVKHNSDF